MKAPKANTQALFAFASYREDLQSVFDGSNGRDSLQIAEGTRIALRQGAEGPWARAFIPPTTLDEGVRDEGIWPRAANVMGYRNNLDTEAGTRPMDV